MTPNGESGADAPAVDTGRPHRPAFDLSRYGPLLLAVIALLAAAALLSGALARRKPADLAGERSEGRVTAERLVVRAQPEAAGTEVMVLPRGARVTIREDRGRWYRVESDGAEVGFVPADGVERDAEREAREKTGRAVLAFSPVFGVVAVDTDLLLGPYPGAPKAGQLESGTVVKIHAVDHDYFALAHEDDGLAYVRSGDVDLVPPDPKRPEIKPGRWKEVRDLTVVDLPPPEQTPGAEGETPASAPEGEAPAEGTDTAVVAGAGVTEEARLLSRVDPVYPNAARRAGVQGMVLLEVVIRSDGRVAEVEVQRGLPLGLSEAAVDAVKRWQYRPAQGPDGAVSSRKVVRIEFRLQ